MRSQRRGWKLLGVALLIVAVLVAARGAIQAQQPEELLRNGNFDTYYGTGSENVIPDSWALSANVPVRSAKQNWVFGEFPPFTHSWQVATSGYTFDMNAYQFVPGVRNGTRLRFSVYANVFTCDNDRSCITAESGRRISQQESQARVRVGVDPQGGSDPAAPSVVWSQFISPFDRFEQLVIDFQSQNDNGVTVFLNASQSVAMLLNHVYFSAASLQLTGASAGAVPGATDVPQFAPYVTPQGQQPDGSVVHIVRTGDTLASIAVGYGVPLAQIRDLNDIPPDEYVIQIGQRLLIKTPTSNVTYIIVTNTPTMDPNATWTATPSPTRTPSRTPTRRAGSGGLATPRVIVITVNPRVPTATPTPNSGAMLAPGAASGERPIKARSRPVQATSSGTICALAYDDANKNRFHDSDEALLSGMILSLSQREQAAVTQITAADSALCFANLAPGLYEMVADPPSNRGLTTPARIRVELSPGAQLGLSFGAADGFEPEPERMAGGAAADIARASSPTPAWLQDALQNSGLIVLGLAGVVLFGGLAFVIFVRRH